MNFLFVWLVVRIMHSIPTGLIKCIMSILDTAITSLGFIFFLLFSLDHSLWHYSYSCIALAGPFGKIRMRKTFSSCNCTPFSNITYNQLFHFLALALCSSSYLSLGVYLLLFLCRLLFLIAFVRLWINRNEILILFLLYVFSVILGVSFFWISNFEGFSTVAKKPFLAH